MESNLPEVLHSLFSHAWQVLLDTWWRAICLYDLATLKKTDAADSLLQNSNLLPS
jgi:hypothetical protein